MKHEYIVQVDDTDRSYDFAFVRQIRRTCRQIVRCKDCKWFYHQSFPYDICIRTDVSNDVPRPMCEDDYCSRAEKKEPNTHER